MVQVPIKQGAGIVIYLLAITGISLLGMKLLSAVAEQVIVLALPHLDNRPPKLSVIEQRRIDTTLAVPPLPEGWRTRITALKTPSMPPNILAARLDLAERKDLIESASSTHVASVADGSLEPDSQPSSIAARTYGLMMFRNVRSRSKYAAVSARDVFNRSFGVLSAGAD